MRECKQNRKCLLHRTSRMFVGLFVLLLFFAMHHVTMAIVSSVASGSELTATISKVLPTVARTVGRRRHEPTRERQPH